MRKYVLKCIACILSLFLITSFAGNREDFTVKAEQTVELAVSANAITLRYFCAPTGEAGILNNLSVTEDYREFEKSSNIKISLIQVPANLQLQKFMVMMAAGDLPDLIEMPWSKYPGILDQSIETKNIIKLNTLIERYAPNINKLLRMDDDLGRQYTADDGFIYQLPGLNMAGMSIDYGPVIRGDLLEKVGMEMPETIDEWEKVLKQFKDQKACKTPLSLNWRLYKRC